LTSEHRVDLDVPDNEPVGERRVTLFGSDPVHTVRANQRDSWQIGNRSVIGEVEYGQSRVGTDASGAAEADVSVAVPSRTGPAFDTRPMPIRAGVSA
jgi:hypothetical protein